MKNSRRVYSTESGRICPECGQPMDNCTCKGSKRREPRNSYPQDGIVRIGREVKGRRGKTVTVVYGLTLGADGLAALAKTLKKRCGSGGSIKNGAIVIQGDHRETIQTELEAAGYSARLAGG